MKQQTSQFMNLVRHVTCAIVIASSSSILSSQASAQSDIPSWEEVGLYYAYYLAGNAYTLGSPLSPNALSAAVSSYGANPAAAAYWFQLAETAADPYYEFGYNQENYYNWYAGYIAAVSWSQGAAAQLSLYDGWLAYGENVSNWYYDYGLSIYDYYNDIAVYYINLINPDLVPQ